MTDQPQPDRSPASRRLERLIGLAVGGWLIGVLVLSAAGARPAHASRDDNSLPSMAPVVTTPTPVPIISAPRASARRAAPTPVPVVPLHLSYVAKTQCRSEARMYVDIVVTALGGKPPFDYYNDATLIAQGTKGSGKFTLVAAVGNPVPLKLIVIDSQGTRYSEDLFFRSTLRCAGK